MLPPRPAQHRLNLVLLSVQPPHSRHPAEDACLRGFSLTLITSVHQLGFLCVLQLPMALHWVWASLCHPRISNESEIMGKDSIQAFWQFKYHFL